MRRQGGSPIFTCLVNPDTIFSIVSFPVATALHLQDIRISVINYLKANKQTKPPKERFKILINKTYRKKMSSQIIQGS